MRYLGGKARSAKDISQIILSDTFRRELYIEPFIGGASVMAQIAPYFNNIVLNDLHPDLIMMWEALYNGWLPPINVSKEEWLILKNEAPSALKGFIGFGSSFNAMFFESYANRTNRNYTAEAYRSCIKKITKILMSSATFSNESYLDLNIIGNEVIYCDPPYANTAGYSTGKFNSELFWTTIDSWVDLGADVYVSEYNAPKHWQVIYEKKLPMTVTIANNPNNFRIEKLFKRAR